MWDMWDMRNFAFDVHHRLFLYLWRSLQQALAGRAQHGALQQAHRCACLHACKSPTHPSLRREPPPTCHSLASRTTRAPHTRTYNTGRRFLTPGAEAGVKELVASVPDQRVAKAELPHPLLEVYGAASTVEQ
jgi:hypothetical protein